MDRGRQNAWRFFLGLLGVGLFFLNAGMASATPAAEHLEKARRHHIAGERAQALEHYRAYLEKTGDGAPERASVLNNLCLVLHDLGRNEEALEACSAALELRRGDGDEARLARALNNHGLVLQALGRWSDAHGSYGEALEINRRRDDAASMAVNLSNLGWLAGLEGRYGEALKLHGQVEDLASHHAESAWAAEQNVIARINRGVVLEKIGAFNEALALYRGLLEEGDRLRPRRWATVEVNMGTVYRNLGEPNLAVDAYRRAAEIFEREKDPAALSNALLNVGQVLHQNLGQLEEAELSYLEALRLARGIGDRGEQIQDLLLLGDLCLQQGRAEEARRYFEGSLELAEEIGSAEGTWSALGGLGRLETSGRRDRRALEHFKAAILVIERTRTGLEDRRLRGDFFASWRHIFEGAVEASWRLHEKEHGGLLESEEALENARQALGLVQRAKERELVEVLGGRALEIGVLDSASWDVEVLRRLGDAALVEYFVTDESLFAWELRKRSLRDQEAGISLAWHRVGDGREIERKVAEIRDALALGQAPVGLEELAPRVLSALTEPTPERLFIAPDGILRYLPFEILPASSGALLDHSVISYLPSASALLRQPDESPRPLALVGLADPEPVRSETPAALEVSSWTRRFALESLDAGRRELESAGGILGGEQRLFFGALATAQALRDAGKAGSRVLHLATHTMIDERRGGAALLLAADGDHDGLVSAENLAGYELRADLTVLAACRTADASQGRGSGFGSLTGAFLAAGSKGVIATLWDVDDGATEVFMNQLYHQLDRGLEPARALAETKRRFAADERWRSPHLWSAYVLVGDPPPVAEAPRRGGPWSFAAVLGLIVLAILSAVLARRRG